MSGDLSLPGGWWQGRRMRSRRGLLTQAPSWQSYLRAQSWDRLTEPIYNQCLERGFPCQVKGAELRAVSRRSSRIRIPSSALILFLDIASWASPRFVSKPVVHCLGRLCTWHSSAWIRDGSQRIRE